MASDGGVGDEDGFREGKTDEFRRWCHLVVFSQRSRLDFGIGQGAGREERSRKKSSQWHEHNTIIVVISHHIRG